MRTTTQLILSDLMEWLIYSAVWIALCAMALCIESSLILQTPLPPWHIFLFVWSSTFCHYNLHYLSRERNESLSRRDGWSREHRSWFRPAILVGGIVSLVCLIRFTLAEFLAVATMAITSLFYSLPLLPFGYRLKQLGVVKPFILAGIWTITTVWLPAHQADPLLLALVLSRRFVFMLILCLSFDIRDLHKDELQGIRTIPVRWGDKFTYQLIDLMLILFTIFAFLVEWELNRPLIFLALLASALLTKMAIGATTQHSSEPYYLGVIDGMMIVQSVLVGFAVLLHRLSG